MARFYGKIGFMKTVEAEGSVYEADTIERYYYGDILQYVLRYEPADKLNDDVRLQNEISIVADSFAYENAYLMKYVEFQNALWKISSIKVERPRIILTIGGVWNE